MRSYRPKRHLIVSFLISSAFLLGGLSLPLQAKPLDKIPYTKAQTKAIQEILYRLQTRHYRELHIDDNLSARYFENYLDTLDPSRMFFYDKDVQSFENNRHLFDDYFKNGKLDAAFDIYHVYRQRLRSRLTSVLELLTDPTVKFNFDEDDEVLLDREGQPWPKTLAEADALWHKRVKLSLLNLKMSGKDFEESKEVMLKRYKRQLKRIEQQNTADVFETIANALTMLYDPHTNYWSPRTSENFDINMRLSLEGIGAVLQSEDDYTKVVRLVVGGPAHKQGQLKPAHHIIGVGQGDDGEMVDVVGWRLDEVVDLIRGPKNTLVRLQVTLPDSKTHDIKEIKINRGKVKLEDQAAQKDVLNIEENGKKYKLGVINLPTFYVDFEGQRQRKLDYKSSSNDVARLLKELMRDNVDGVILDLRNNGGGSLQEAVSLTDLFIDQGPVVQIRSPDDRINRHHRSRFKALYNGPLIVLVNRLSASASEIFAGAIQDYNRGIVVGAQTFGKGTVQSVTPLVEGGLKITESKFYRVSGDSTQHRGVIPDIEIPLLIDPDEVGESTYDNALPWDKIHAVPHSEYFDFSTILPVVKSLHDKRTRHDPDFKYLMDQVDIMERNKQRKTISLNEKKRIDEKDKLEMEAMTIENKRRIAKDLKAYKNVEEYRTAEEEEEKKNEAAPATERQAIDLDSDTILLESGSILVDIIRLGSRSAEQQAAYRQ